MSSIAGVQWEDLAVVLAALRQGSLNQVAKALGVSQSTASRRLVRIEDQLGVRLFDRTPDGLMPTSFARELAPFAEGVEDQMASIERWASGLENVSGRVRFALPNGLAETWLVPRLHSFYDVHPEVSVDLVIGHGVVDLMRREADMALRFIRPESPDLVVQWVGQLPMAPFIHPAATAGRWIVFDDPNGTLMETQWVQQHVAPERTMAVSVWNALFAAVCNKLGAAILSPLVAKPAGLVEVEGYPEVPGRDLFLVYHPAFRDTPRFTAFRAWLRDEIDAMQRYGVGGQAPSELRKSARSK